MIEKLIYDARELEKDATTGEVEANEAYAQLVADTNSLVKDKGHAVVNMTEEMAKAEMEVEQKTEALGGVKDELKELRTLSGELHEECDFLVKNFDARQAGRQQEIEAIQQAKGILD